MSRYLVANRHTEMDGWRRYFEVPTEEIKKMYPTANTIYVDKDLVLDLEAHNYSNEGDDFELTEDNVEEYYAIPLYKVNDNRIEELIRGYDGDLMEYNEDMVQCGEEESVLTASEVLFYLQEILNYPAEEWLEDDSYYSYYDGSNWQRILVESSYQDLYDYQDHTEELQGMERVGDMIEGDTGHTEFYRTREGKVVEVYTSYYQGEGKSIKFHTSKTLERLREDTGIELEEGIEEITAENTIDKIWDLLCEASDEQDIDSWVAEDMMEVIRKYRNR